MSGKRFLNSRATPLPITPTQLTVLTSVCASESNKLPIFTATIRKLPLGEKQVPIHSHGQSGNRSSKQLLCILARGVRSHKITRVNAIWYQNFRAFRRLLSEVLNWVWVSPIFGESECPVDDFQTCGSRCETHVVAACVAIRNHNPWQI